MKISRSNFAVFTNAFAVGPQTQLVFVAPRARITEWSVHSQLTSWRLRVDNNEKLFKQKKISL